jgi:hypothetical protein
VRAIQIYRHASLAKDTGKRVERARAWLSAQKPENTEERAYQLFGLYWARAGKSELAGRAAGLAASQQPDGGRKSSTGGRATLIPLARH